MGRPLSNECQKGHAKGPGECPRCRRTRQQVYMQSDQGKQAGSRASRKYLRKKKAVSYTDNSPQGDPDGCHQERALPQNVIQSAGQDS